MAAPRTKHRPGNAGFSLIELGTALFIVTVGTFGALTMFIHGLDKVRAINESRVAVRAAQNEIETRRAMPFDQLMPGNSPFVSQTPELERLGEARTAVLIADDTSVAPARLRRITASVAWVGENGRRIEKRLSTLLADKGP